MDEFGILMILSKENLNGPNSRGRYGDGAARHLAREPFPTPQHARLPIQGAMEAYTDVLTHAGAWPRDAVDMRLIREVREKQGAIGRVGPRWRKIYEEFQKKKRGGK